MAIDIVEEPVPALEEFVRREGLGDNVRLHYRVDQSDRRRLTHIIDEHFGAQPLDLVIDDASHLYDPTLASFEVLFPRLRPGGRYIIEDWSAWSRLPMWLESAMGQWDPDALRAAVEQAQAVARDKDSPQRNLALAFLHETGTVEGDPVDPSAAPPRPLADLVCRMVQAKARGSAVIERIEVNDNWTLVTRGEAVASPGEFALP